MTYLFFFCISSTRCWMCSCMNSIFSLRLASPRCSLTIRSISIWLLGSTCSVITRCSWTGSWLLEYLLVKLWDWAELFSDIPTVFRELLELVRDPILVESFCVSPFVSKFSSFFLACCSCLVMSYILNLPLLLNFKFIYCKYNLDAIF